MTHKIDQKGNYVCCLQAEQFIVRKETTLIEFKHMVAQKWQIPKEKQQYWYWATRSNSSVRVTTPLGPQLDTTRVCDIRVLFC